MAELKFGIYGDSTSFKKALEEATKGVTQAKTKIESEGKSMSSVFDSLKKATTGLGVAFGLNELKNLAIQIGKTRSDFQQLEVSFKTMLGSGEKANAMLKQLTTTAATTPFGLQEVAGGAKQLLAYGIEAEKVNDMLIRLGDIASGLSIPLNDLVYLYGTTMTQGRMFTQDLRQFQGRGIPIADELAKQFGIAKSQVGDFVTAGKVGAKEVEQAIINMTSAGSQFGGLMKAQSETIGGRWSNIEDQIDMAFNEIGKNSEGFINGFLDSINYLIENYKTIGTYLGGIIASYGVWKATLIAHNAISKTMADGEVANLAKITKANLDAMKAEESRLDLEMEEAEKNNDVDKYVELGSEKEALAKKIETTEEQLNTLAKTQNTTATQANAVATTTNATATNVNASATKANTIAIKAQNLAIGLGTKAVGLFKGAWNGLKTAFMSNPIGMIAIGITSVITAITAWKSKQEELNKSLEEGKEKAKSYFNTLSQESQSIKSYVETIRDKNADDLEQIKAYRELMKLVPEITNQYSQQALATLEAAEAENILTEAIRKREVEKTKKTGEMASNIISKIDQGLSWEDYSADERKFLKEDMQMDEDFDKTKMKIQLQEVAKEANIATQNLTQMNKVADLQNMEKGEKKTKSLNNEMSKLDAQLKSIQKAESFFSGKYLKNLESEATKIANSKQTPSDDMIKWTENFNQAKRELVNEWSKSSFNTLSEFKIDFKSNDPLEQLREIRDNIIKAKKQVQDEIDADSGIELNPLLNLSTEELKNGLVDAENEITELIRTSEDALSNEQLEATILATMDADVNDEKAQIEFASAMSILNARAQELGQDRYIFQNTTLEAQVQTRYKQGWMENLTNIPTHILLSGNIWDNWTKGNDKNGNPVDLQVQLARKTEEANRYKKLYEEATKPKSKPTTQKTTKPKTTTKSGKSGSSNSSKSGKSQTELNQDYEKAKNEFKELEEEQARERAENIADRENTLRQLAIDLSADANAKYIEQMKLNAKKQNEEYEKQRKDAIDKEKQMREQYHNAQQNVKEAEAKKGGKKYTKTSYNAENDEAYKQAVLEINKYYDELIAKNNRKTEKDIYLSKMQSRWNYLKEFGSSYQKELSLVEEYEQKIADAKAKGDEWEAKRLAKEKKQRVSAMKFEDISMGIDWATLFNGVANISSDMLKPMLEQLQAYTKTEEYSQAEAQTQQNIVNLIRELRGYLGSEMTTSFNDLATAITNFNNSVVVYQKAKSAEDSYAKTLAQAKADFDSGKITREAFDEIRAKADELGDATANARESMTNFATTLNTTNDAIINSTSKLTSALNNAKGWKGLDGFSEVAQSSDAIDKWKGALDTSLASMENGLGRTLGTSLSKSIGTGLNSMGGTISNALSSSLGTTIGFVAQIPQLILSLADTIKNFVKGILDSFSELLSFSWLEDLVNSILDAISNLINTIFDLPENIFKVLESIVVKGVGGLLNTIIGRIGNILTFGALSSKGPADWFLNSNAEEVQDTIEKLTDRNETLTKSIEHLAFEIEQARGAITLSEYDKAYKLQEEMNENYKEMAKAQASYHNAHRSWNYYWEGFTDEQLASIGAQIGENWNGDIWDLTPEQMAIVLSDPSIRDAIKNTGEGDYGSRVLEKLDEYADQANTLTDLTDKLNESLTGMSFDAMYDSFVSSLMDMEYSAEDAANNISEYFMKAMISNVIGEKYMELLEGWYQRFSDYMASDGLDAKETQELTNDYLQMTNDAIAERDAIADLVGYNPDGSSSSTSASGRGIESMTQQEAEELNGRFTALQIAGEAIRTQSSMTNGLLQALTQQIAPSITASEGMNATLKELRELAWQRNNYLSDISDYSKNLLAIKKSLSQIESNTQNL